MFKGQAAAEAIIEEVITQAVHVEEDMLAIP